MKFDNGVRFSYGWAELALKKPPPLFVPIILIASYDTKGLIANVWVGVVSVSITRLPLASLIGCASAPTFGC